MKAKIRGTEIYFDIAGMELHPVGGNFVKRPILFMLHGGPGGDHLRFKQHSLELQDVAQLVFIDHRGCGQSKKTKQKEYTLENNIQDVEALRKYLGLEQISILGTSYGGMVAQGYAIRYPQHVEKLILVATSPSYRFMKEAKKYLEDHATPKQMAISKHLWEGTFKNHKHVVEFFKKTDAIYSTSSKKNRNKAYSKSKTIWSHEALNQGFRTSLRTFDFIHKLKKIKSPTLILAGEKDWICHPSHAKIMAENIRHSKLKVFKKSGHAVAIDAHKEYIKIIKKFMIKRKKSKKA